MVLKPGFVTFHLVIMASDSGRPAVISGETKKQVDNKQLSLYSDISDVDKSGSKNVEKPPDAGNPSTSKDTGGPKPPVRKESKRDSSRSRSPTSPYSSDRYIQSLLIV